MSSSLPPFPAAASPAATVVAQRARFIAWPLCASLAGALGFAGTIIFGVWPAIGRSPITGRPASAHAADMAAVR